jgi:hypothetical protein
MRIPTNARSARSAVLGVAVVAALATGGLAYGSAAEHHDHSTADAQIGKAAAPGTVRLAGTAKIVPKQGVKASPTTSKRSTAERTPPATRSPARTATDVDKSDKGVKNLRATTDGGKRNVPAKRDLGAR